MPTQTKKSKKKGRQNTQGNWKTRKKWKQMENVGMRPSMSADDLVLNWVKKKIPDYDYKGAVESMSISRTIEGATTITVVLRDPDSKLFGSLKGHMRESLSPKFKKQPEPVDEGWEQLDVPNLVGRAVDLELDGVVFRLTKIKYNYSNAQLTLIFEDRVIYWLRLKGGTNGPGRHANRKDVTRAQFILSLLREIKAEKVPFVCPELYTIQKIAKIPEEEWDDDSDDFRSKKGLTVKGVKATPEQKRNMELVIATARNTDGSSNRSVMAAIVAVIVESLVKNLPGGDADSRGILQVRDATAKAHRLNNRDIGACVEEFCEKGFWGKGGANDLAKEHPNKSVGWIAQQTQGSAHPERYDLYRDEAQAWFEAATGLNLSTFEGDTYKKSFQYKRDKEEDSWTCMKRLADEVNWRVFMVGRTMYYMSEPQLFRRRVRYRIRKGDPALIDLDYEIDWSRATVNEATAIVNLDRWGAPPGSVIDINGFGAPDGRWLVVEMNRDWFGTTAEIILRQPIRPKAEEAPEVGKRDQPAGVGDIEKLMKACQNIHKKKYPYVWGGGHARAGTPDGGTGRDPGIGYDCSGSVGAVLAKAGLGFDIGQPVPASGHFGEWGRRGRGDLFTVCYSGKHVYIRFESGAGVDYERFDTSDWGDKSGSGARLRLTQGPPEDSGYSLRHWPDM